MSNLATTGTKAVSQFLNQENVLKKFADLLGTKAQGFIASVITIVNSNDKLKNATNESIYSAALMAATLDLPLNQSLGFAYIVPYNNTKLRIQEAQFQLGYKGLKQLAQRSGQIFRLHETDVRDGELINQNRLTGDIEFKWIEDYNTRQALPIIGYVSYFKTVIGFESTLYMSKNEIENHAKRYSQSYKSGFGVWKDDFDSMAKKTVCKLNIQRNAPMSIEMQKAVIADQGIIRNIDTMEVEYPDNTKEITTPLEIDEAKAIQNCEDFINNAKTVEELEQCKVDAETFGLNIEYSFKLDELKGLTK
jgi:recombination protein RecT